MGEEGEQKSDGCRGIHVLLFIASSGVLVLCDLFFVNGTIIVDAQNHFSRAEQVRMTQPSVPAQGRSTIVLFLLERFTSWG